MLDLNIITIIFTSSFVRMYDANSKLFSTKEAHTKDLSDNPTERHCRMIRSDTFKLTTSNALDRLNAYADGMFRFFLCPHRFPNLTPCICFSLGNVKYILYALNFDVTRTQNTHFEYTFV